MKRIIFLWLMVFLATGVFSQIDISVGGQVGMGAASSSFKYEVDSDNYMTGTTTDTMLAFGAFVDATYARLSLSYGMALGGSTKSTLVVAGDETESTDDRPDDYAVSVLNIDLLGKYPIKLGSVVIWPAAGILYSMVLSMDADGDGEDDDLADTALNDLYLSLGCGVDFTISGNLFVTGCALFSLNLTPNPTQDDLPDEVSVSGYIIGAYIGVGYKL